MAPTFEVLRPGLAAEVRGVDLGDALDPGMLEWIVAVWRWHAVLVFRDQPLTPDAQLAFSRHLGELDRAPLCEARRTDLQGYPEIAVLSNIVVDGAPIGGLNDGDLTWHSDMTDAPASPVACLLHARELPPHGGDTLYLDLRAAWRALPAALQDRTRRVRIFHASAGTSRLDALPGAGAWHPVRITDPLSGEPALRLGHRSSSRTAADEAALLETLWRQVDRAAAEHVYRHMWRRSDAVLWNNLAVMHRREAFDTAARRLLHRTQIRRFHPHWERTACEPALSA